MEYQVHKILTAALAMSALPALSACGPEQVAQERPPPSVIVAPVVEKEIVNTIEFIGQTVAVNQVSLRARVSGYIEERLFTEGDDVERGAQLLVIDQDPFRAEVNRAKAALAQAEADLERAQKDLTRYSGLVKEGAASQQQVDRTQSEVLQGAAIILARKAELEQAQLNLGYTEIAAPIAGRIGRAEVTEGNLVGPESGELAFLVQLNPIYVTFSISEKELINAKQRMLKERINLVETLIPSLRLPNGTMYEHPGRIDFIDNTVDPNTGTVAVRCVFENTDNLILPGQFVTVVLQQDEPVQHLTVPQVAVLEDQVGRYVLVADKDNKVEQRRVTTGGRDGGDWIVREGLEENERVLIYGLQKVQPGMVVNAKLSQDATEAPEGDAKEGSSS
jgi:membrane fusion protein (multidrug efflux system)